MKKESWIYEHDKNLHTRYALGVKGKRMLAILGANPSTAQPGFPDPTVKRIYRFTSRAQFDGWILFNLWPEITPNPKALRKGNHPQLERRNSGMIIQSIKEYPVHAVWAAWGNIIETRSYFIHSLSTLCTFGKICELPWLQLSPPTQKGHPRHPLYASSSSELIPFEINSYLQSSKLQAHLSK